MLSLAMAIGFYIWLLSGATPLVLTGGVLRVEGEDFLRGLWPALAEGLGAGLLIAVLLGLMERDGTWRARIAAASAGLYIAALRPAVGPVALMAAPAAVLVELGVLALWRKAITADGLFLALHAGGFGAAVAFFHQWGRYQPGWGEFLRNVKALFRLWF